MSANLSAEFKTHAPRGAGDDPNGTGRGHGSCLLRLLVDGFSELVLQQKLDKASSAKSDELLSGSKLAETNTAVIGHETDLLRVVI